MSERDSMDQEEIHSKVLRAGRRTYFFDVRSTKAGDYYLTITESKKFTHDDGSTAFDRWGFTTVFDFPFDTGDVTFNGSSFNVHASGGGGILFTDSGKLVYSGGGDVIHGPHDSYGLPDPVPVVDAAICDAWAS